MVKYELVNLHIIQNAQDAICTTKLFYSFEINLDDAAYWVVVGMFAVLFVSILNWPPNFLMSLCKYVH